VAASASPTVRRRLLAAELRRLCGVQTGGAVARALAWSPAKISRYELGQTNFPLDEVEKLLDFYGWSSPAVASCLPSRRKPASRESSSAWCASG
jgi:hypothetical protein